MAARKRWDVIAGEVEWLIGTDTPDNIARRLGFTRESLDRQLHRHGYHALANRLFKIGTVEHSRNQRWAA